MGNGAYSKRLRVAGNVQPGSIKRTGTHVQFVLMEQDQLLSVDYTGTEAPPDTFKDDSQALADGSFGPRRCFSRQGAAGEMRIEVCAAAARHARQHSSEKHDAGATRYSAGCGFELSLCHLAGECAFYTIEITSPEQPARDFEVPYSGKINSSH